MVKRVKQGDEGKKPFEWKARPIIPCACGKPQLCAVVVNHTKIPKCAECYAAFWTPERIAGR